MKKVLKSPISLLYSAVLTLTLAQSAYATIIIDEYVGGDDHGYGDVIGTDVFNILSMDVQQQANNIFSVTINTNFAGKGDEGRFASSTLNDVSNGKGIGYGDLFLSNAWTPVGDAPYSDDNYFAVGTTDWSLAFSLDDRWTDGGTGSLFSLDGNDDNDILLSEDLLPRNTFRNGQEIAVDTTG